jgi:hypothetical protein
MNKLCYICHTTYFVIVSFVGLCALETQLLDWLQANHVKVLCHSNIEPNDLQVRYYTITGANHVQILYDTITEPNRVIIIQEVHNLVQLIFQIEQNEAAE